MVSLTHRCDKRIEVFDKGFLESFVLSSVLSVQRLKFTLGLQKLVNSLHVFWTLAPGVCNDAHNEFLNVRT